MGEPAAGAKKSRFWASCNWILQGGNGPKLPKIWAIWPRPNWPPLFSWNRAWGGGGQSLLFILMESHSTLLKKYNNTGFSSLSHLFHLVLVIIASLNLLVMWTVCPGEGTITSKSPSVFCHYNKVMTLYPYDRLLDNTLYNIAVHYTLSPTIVFALL